VVDLGCDTDESWERFLQGLTKVGKSLHDIRGAVITHIHPDHYGLAGRLKQHTDAWIAVHPGELSALVPDERGALRRIDEMAAWLRQCVRRRQNLTNCGANRPVWSLPSRGFGRM
jgi:glyoxylase-like metal-dependent hydrolase (beta-lactamase superfamily II)